MAMQEPLPPPPKRGEGFMGRGQKQEMPDFSGITSDVNSLSRRIRLLEEGSTNLRRFLQITEENMIAKNKHYSAEIKTINSDIIEVTRFFFGLICYNIWFIAKKLI